MLLLTLFFKLGGAWGYWVMFRDLHPTLRFQLLPVRGGLCDAGQSNSDFLHAKHAIILLRYLWPPVILFHQCHSLTWAQFCVQLCFGVWPCREDGSLELVNGHDSITEDKPCIYTFCPPCHCLESLLQSSPSFHQLLFLVLFPHTPPYLHVCPDETLTFKCPVAIKQECRKKQTQG